MSLDSFHVWVQLRRFSNNSMVESFLDSISNWMIPDYAKSNKSWITVLLGVFDMVDTIEDSRTAEFSKNMKRIIYNVLQEKVEGSGKT
jgi:hypothetical protein